MSASNDEFGTSAQVAIEIPQSELRNARQQIESEIGAVEVGITDGGSMSAQTAGGGGSGGRERRRRRREFRWARERTDYLETVVEILDDIEDDVGDGDGGILSELLGGGAVGGILGGAGGAAGGIGSGIATGIGSGIGSAVGSAVGDAIGGESVAVEEPNWTPLDVDHPEEPYEVDHPEEPYALDHPEEPYALDHPEEPYALDHPEEPYAVDHPNEPYAVADPSPLEVEEVEPIDVNVSVETTTRNVEPSTDVPDTLTDPDAVDLGGGSDSDTPDSILDGPRHLRERTREWTEKVPVVGKPFADLDRSLEDRLSGGSSSGGSADPLDRPRGGPTGGLSTSTPSVENTFNITQTINPEVIVDELRETADAISEIQDAVEDGYDDLESQIDDIRSELDDLERQIRN